MKKKLRENFKLVILIFVLSFGLFACFKFLEKSVFADVTSSTDPQDVTNYSLSRPSNVKNWRLKPETDGKVLIKSLEAPTLSELLPAEQVKTDGIFISAEDLTRIPSLFCCALDVSLPSLSDGVAYGRTVTDQGWKLSFLTRDQIPVATIFNNPDDLIVEGFAKDVQHKDYYEPPVESRTVGFFPYSKMEVRQTTPAEAWVLNEFDRNLETPENIVGSNASEEVSFERTGETYNGDVDEKNYIEVDGKKLYKLSGGTVGNEQYVEKDENGTYHRVTSNTNGYSYVQNAWWKVKTCGTDSSSAVETDLQHEAEAFEAYVKEATGVTEVKDIPINSDHTFKIDYKVSMEPKSTDDVHVRFNSITNKYIVGPFSVNYLRSVTKQGNRDKVSFSGISDVLLVGLDGNGNELVDEEGNSRLKLNENYRFVYEDPEEHERKRNVLDTEEEYPYPASDEEFYLEIDYLDDLCAIQNLKFDFQYITSGGVYEYYKGDYYQIKWGHACDLEEKKESESYTKSDGTTGTRTVTLLKYSYWVNTHGSTQHRAQDQANAVGKHEIINVDAANGLGTTESGIPVELEFLERNVNLRTRLAGEVWIDNDEQKDKDTGTLGIYDDNEKPADKNSVEILVWKVTYDSSGNEKAREKAIGWREDGSEINFNDNRLYIDENGSYLIPEIQVPSKEGKSEDEIISYDVEFIYDGQTYEATEYLKSAGDGSVSDRVDEFQKTPDETAGAEKDYEKYARDSYIVENADERKVFDSYFTEVYGKDSIDGSSGNTNGLASGGDSGIYYFEYGQPRGKVVGAKSWANENGQSDKIEYYTEDVGNKETELQYVSNTVGDGDFAKRQSTLVTRDSEGYVLPQYKFASRTSEAGLLLPYERLYHPERENYDNLMFRQEPYKPIDEYFMQINLGLLERYEADLSLMKDLYSSKVIVNNQESATYTFNNLGELTEEALHQQVEAGYRTKSYKIDLYNSDYYYRSSVYNSVQDTLTRKILNAVKDGTDLRLFVTYRISIKNESVLTDASINEFKDYYDSTFTLIREDEVAKIEATDVDAEGKAVYQEKVVAYAPYYRKLVPDGDSADLYRWNKDEDLQASRVDSNKDGNKCVGNVEFSDIESGNSRFKGSVSQSLRDLNNGNVNEDMTLEPGEAFEVFVTYEVDREGFAQIQAEKNNNPDSEEAGRDVNRDNGLLGQKNNIAEISNYSTVYTTEYENRHKTTRYKAGNVSGRIDRDSAPDNINMNLIDNTDFIEDDTEFAPTLMVSVKNPDERSLDGIVWEDEKLEGSSDGNGIYDENESCIDNVDVTLVEKIRVTTDDVSSLISSDNSFANMSILDYEFEYIWPDNYIDGLTSRVRTADGGKYSYKNFVAGNYVVRFEYGNNDDTLKYNGQDYKMAVYQTGMTNATTVSEDTVTGTSNMMNLAGKSTLNNEWHDLSNNDNAKILEEQRVSDARDYEPRRMKVMAYSRTVSNKNAEVLAGYINSQEEESITDEYRAILEANREDLKANTAMVANTAKFKVDVEKQDTIAYKTVKITDGEEAGQDKHEYRIANIDFGLIERPETKINIKKEVSKIQLTKNDGTDVVLSVECDDDGNIIKSNGSENMSGNINLNKISEIEKVNLALGTQGFKYVAIESSFLNGLDVDLTYKFTVYNDSETDYVGERLANMKNVQELYDKVVAYETRVIDDLENENYGLVPFNTGKGIVYGRYIGLHYYTNEVSTESLNSDSKYGYAYEPEKVVTTTIDQVADYIDNDISLNKEYTTMIENQSWVDSNEEDREHKFSVVSYKDNTRDDSNFIDNKGRSYLDGNRNNLVLSDNENIELTDVTYSKTALGDDELPLTQVEGGLLLPQMDNINLSDVYSVKENVHSGDVSVNNPSITSELEPGESAKLSIVTSMHSSEESSKNMNYDNLAEIVVYSNTVGRRDMKTIPGNSNMFAKQEVAWKAGYSIDYATKAQDGAISDIGYFRPNDVTVNDNGAEKVIKTERDAYGARDTITFSEPTGLSLTKQIINNTVSVILVVLGLSAIAVIVATIVIVFKKTKYDDSDLLNFDNKN